MSVQPQVVQELIQEGYSMKEIQDAMGEIQLEEAGLKAPDSPYQAGNPYQVQGGAGQGMHPLQYAQTSAFTPQNQDNLIKWQLELDNILERAEHILRGDVLVFESGNLIWKKNDITTNNILNEYGVQEIMRVLSTYLNRNTVLSDYEDEEIREKVLDFGKELNDLFFMKYEEIFNYPTYQECKEIFLKKKRDKEMEIQDIYKDIFGLRVSEDVVNDIVMVEKGYQEIVLELKRIRNDLTLAKRKNYPMLHRQLVDIVHSAYKRALHGGERRSLREARQITQSESLQAGQGGVTVNAMGNQQQRGVLNPMRYIAGKYK